MQNDRQNINLVLTLLFTFLFIQGIILIVKIYIISSLGAIVTLPISLIVAFYVVVNLLANVKKSMESSNLIVMKKITIGLVVLYVFSTVFILIEIEDGGPFGFNYQIDFRHYGVLLISAFFLIYGIGLLEFYRKNVIQEYNDMLQYYQSLIPVVKRFTLDKLTPVQRVDEENGTIIKLEENNTYYLVIGYNLTDTTTVINFLNKYFILKEQIFLKPSNTNNNLYPNEYCTDENITQNLVYLVKSNAIKRVVNQSATWNT